MFRQTHSFTLLPFWKTLWISKSENYLSFERIRLLEKRSKNKAKRVWNPELKDAPEDSATDPVVGLVEILGRELTPGVKDSETDPLVILVCVLPKKKKNTKTYYCYKNKKNSNILKDSSETSKSYDEMKED